MKHRAIIAEDEPLLAAQLQKLLARAWPALEVVATARNGVDALAAIERERPQVAFLDIRMPGLSGLEVATELADRTGKGETPPVIVFVTAYDEYALKAFELAAIDYLLKPVTEERLARTAARVEAALAKPAGVDALVEKLRALMAAAPAAAPAAPAAPLRHLQAGAGSTVRMIPVDSICYFQASDKYTGVALRDGSDALIRTPLKELLAQLPAERFRQVHRGIIVNLDEVSAAVRDDAGRITLRLRHRKETLPVSRLYAELFRQM